MIVYPTNKYGVTKVHFEDTDSYEVTSDNGVDIYLSRPQLKELKSINLPYNRYTHFDWSKFQEMIEDIIKTYHRNGNTIKPKQIADYIPFSRHRNNYMFTNIQQKTLHQRIGIALGKDVLGTGWERWKPENRGNPNGGTVWVIPWVN